jgi:hypothetical protein
MDSGYNMITMEWEAITGMSIFGATISMDDQHTIIINIKQIS